MSNVFFISDLHFRHRSLIGFAGLHRYGTTMEEHDELLIESINKTVTKRDKLFVLGDCCFGPVKVGLELLGRLNGRSKELIIGNHDRYNVEDYLKVFNKVHGFKKYKGEFWLSHCPVHPLELRGIRNIHGHVHANPIMDHYGDVDKRFINVSVESCNGVPVCYDDIVSGKHTGLPKLKG